MKQQMTLIVLAFAAAASAQVLKTDHMRLGVPDTPMPHTVRAATDVADLDDTHTPTDAFDPVMEAELDSPTSTYGHGAQPQLTVRLKRADGSLMPGDVYTDDPHEKGPRKGQPRGPSGEYTVTLDNTPGEHTVDVNADVVVNGASTHRGVSVFYEVGTGRVTLVDVGPTRQDGTTLYVPLVLNVALPDRYTFGATLNAKGIVVASATTVAVVKPGDTIELQFALSDLVEPGPYRLTNVTVTGSAHKGEGVIGGIPPHAVADARPQLGKPIEVRRDKNVGPPQPPPTLTAEEQAGRDAALNPGGSAAPDLK